MACNPIIPGLLTGALLGVSVGGEAWAEADAPVAISVNARATTDAREVKGRFVLKPQVDNAGALQAQIGLEAGAGVPAATSPGVRIPDNGGWRDFKVTAQASWKTSRAKLAIEASEALKLSGTGGLSEDRVATVNAVVTPASPLAVNLSGQIADNYALKSSPGGLSGAGVSMTREAAVVAAGVVWTVSPQLTLKGQQRVEAANLTWRGEGLFQGDGSVVRPVIEGVLKLTPGSEINLKAEEFASPFDVDKFAALAEAMFRVEPVVGSRPFIPDREMRLGATAAQRLGAARLTVSVVNATLQSSTELAHNALGQNAPVSVAGGWRSDLSIGLETPLRLAELTGLTFRTDWTRRSSELRDPVTGMLRSISGEAAWDGRVSFVYTPFGNGVSFGLDSLMTGPRTFYEPSRLREVAAFGRLGSFVEYHTDDLALRLQIDNLLDDAARVTDTQFQRDRASGQILQIDRRQDGASAISLTLKHKV